MTSTKEQGEAKSLSGETPSPSPVRYEYSSIEAALDTICEDNRFAIQSQMDDEVLSPEQRFLLDESDELFTKFFIQGVKDLLYFHCQGFERNQEYPRAIIADAASYLLSKPSFDKAVEIWVANNVDYWAERNIRRDKCSMELRRLMCKWCEIVGTCLGGFSGNLGLFSAEGFNLKKAKDDKELSKRYQPATSKPGPKPTQTSELLAPHYLTLFYLALRQIEDKPKSQSINKNDFLGDFEPVFKKFSEMRSETWELKSSTLDEYCLKRKGKYSGFVNSYLINYTLTAFNALTPELQRMLRATVKNNFRRPENWQEILRGDF